MIYQINFYSYKLTEDDRKIMQKMALFLEKTSGKAILMKPVDVLLYNDSCRLDYDGVMFGEKVEQFAECKCKWLLPPIVKLHADGDKDLRRKAMGILHSLAEEIKNKVENPEDKQESYVEEQGVKFGNLQDIELTEKEAEHLKNIKKILGGGKIVIKKGSVTVEVE